MTSIKKLLRYLRPYRLLAIAAPLLMLLEVVMDLMQPRLLEEIIDVGIARLDMGVVLQTGLLMLGAALLGALGGMGNTFASVRAAQAFSADLRSDLFRKVQSFSFGNLDALDTGQLITRLTNDVTQVGQMVLMSLRIMVRAPLILIGSIILGVITSPRLALLFVVLLPLLLGILALTARRAYPLFSMVQQKLDRLNTILQEYLAGVRVVKAFVRSDYEEGRFGDANREYRDQSMRAFQLLAMVMPLLMFLMNLGLVGALWFGGVQVNLGTLQAGQLVAFINYLMRALNTLAMLAMFLMHFSRAQASADRVVEVLEATPEIVDSPGALEPQTLCGALRFENVTFSYNGEEHAVLHDINFSAEPGKTIAVLGATGAGKSSLINLIPRFYDVKKGRITMDGVDIRQLSQHALRSRIGVALQEAVLFTGTIRENIRYGKPEATEEEVITAAKAAQAHEFIMAFPEGYDTLIGQRGVNLSGGQKQRIAIARALLVQPDILILDDTTSAVDAETEAKIQAALENSMGDRTSFVIAQRISTVLNADCILVLEDGRLAAQGTHAELMQTSPIYREIYDSQLGSGISQSTLLTGGIQ